MKSGVCPKCQGTSILANISLKDEFHNGFDSQVAVNPTPGAFSCVGHQQDSSLGLRGLWLCGVLCR
jgi:hypothetical protein